MTRPQYTDTNGFEPLVYRPALPLRWWERALKAVGWKVAPRYGKPVPFVYHRHASGSVYSYPRNPLHNRRKYDGH